MNTILFVDDEANVLNGLRRMLRSMRTEWVMHFANSGAEALQILDSTPVDVLVSDMQMPGMNGLELLTKVKSLHPLTVRIVLSGESARVTIVDTLDVAHQFIAKPCDESVLKQTITRACALRGFLSNEPLQRLVSQVKSLPSPPKTYFSIVEELQDENASLRRVAEIICEDTGMAARILQLANSAFFGVNRAMSSVVQAVNFLGSETIRQLVLLAHMFSGEEGVRTKAFSIDRLW